MFIAYSVDTESNRTEPSAETRGISCNTSHIVTTTTNLAAVVCIPSSAAVCHITCSRHSPMLPMCAGATANFRFRSIMAPAADVSGVSAYEYCRRQLATMHWLYIGLVSLVSAFRTWFTRTTCTVQQVHGLTLRSTQ